MGESPLNIIRYGELSMVWIFWDLYESVKESVKDNVGSCQRKRGITPGVLEKGVSISETYLVSFTKINSPFRQQHRPL
jgi:hypothetical protein